MFCHVRRRNAYVLRTEIKAERRHSAGLSTCSSDVHLPCMTRLFHQPKVQQLMGSFCISAKESFWGNVHPVYIYHIYHLIYSTLFFSAYICVIYSEQYKHLLHSVTLCNLISVNCSLRGIMLLHQLDFLKE